MVDSSLGYSAPAVPNTLLDSEGTGRVVGGVAVDRQRVSDPALLAELAQKLEPADLAALATAANQLAAKTRLDLLATEAKLEAVRALLTGTLSADVTDRVARILGHVIVDTSALPAGAATEAKVEAIRALLAGTLSADVTDRAARLLGHVAVDSLPLPPGAATQTTLADVLTKQYVQRPTEKAGRAYVAGTMDAATADTTVHTVTTGKRLYITSWGVNLRNMSTNAGGHLRLKDSGALGAIVASWVLPTSVVGAIAPYLVVSGSFPEPKRIDTDLFMQFVAGDVRASFQFTGYEESV